MIQIWTDGACSGNPGPGGWAFIIKSEKEDVRCSGGNKHTTNNIMELTSVIEAVKAIPEGTEAVLTSDSKYVISGITEWIHGWINNNWKKSNGKDVLNKELWEVLFNETKKRKIEFVHVRGHQGNEMNEDCDKLRQTNKGLKEEIDSLQKQVGERVRT